MTRQYFIDNYTTLGELKRFCDDYNLYSCDGLYYYDQINDEIMEIAQSYVYWEDLKEFISNIPTGYDWYAIYEGNVSGADYDFDEYFNNVLDEADNIRGFWDDDIYEEEIILDEEFAEDSHDIVFIDGVFSNILSGV